MALVYLEGMRRERAAAAARGARTVGRAPPTAPVAFRLRPGRSLAACRRRRFEIADCPPSQVARAAARAGRERRAGAGARAPRAWPTPARARAFLAARRGAPAARRSPASARRWRRSSTTSRAGARITIHGDYDVDGICSTAVLVRALRDARRRRRLLLPDRAGDGYGLSREHRAAPRRAGHAAADDGRLRDHGGRGGRAGTRRSASTWSSPTTTRRAPTARCRRRRSCTRACAATRARTCAPRPSPTSSPRRCRRRRGERASRRDAREMLERGRSRRISTSWRWRRSPTSCRCTGENRALVRRGLRALAATRQARAARADGRRRASTRRKVDERAVGVRAGAAPERRRAPVPRRRRASSWSSPRTPPRAAQIAGELDAANRERRQVEHAHPLRGRSADGRAGRARGLRAGRARAGTPA